MNSPLRTLERFEKALALGALLPCRPYALIRLHVPIKVLRHAAILAGFKGPEQISKIKNTGVNPEVLKQVGQAVTALPEGFNPHRGIRRVYEARQKMIETGEVRDRLL